MSKRKTPGAGTVPAPAGPVDQAQALIRQLREELREARGALGDLVRERKAVEQLARSRAEAVIEGHVNAMLVELGVNLNGQLVEHGNNIQLYFGAMLDHYLNPQKHGKPDAPSVPEILAATEVINRAVALGFMKAPAQGGPGAAD